MRGVRIESEAAKIGFRGVLCFCVLTTLLHTVAAEAALVGDITAVGVPDGDAPNYSLKPYRTASSTTNNNTIYFPDLGGISAQTITIDVRNISGATDDYNLQVNNDAFGDGWNVFPDGGVLWDYEGFSLSAGVTSRRTWGFEPATPAATKTYEIELVQDGIFSNPSQEKIYITCIYDALPPSTPTISSASVASSSSINVSWSNVSDAVSGVHGYALYRNGTLVGTTQNTSYSDTGRSQGVTYSYTVASVDRVGNVSNQSSAVSCKIIRITVGTSPSGRSFSVDGSPYSSSQTLYRKAGSSHTIATTTPQGSYTFTNWSDSGAISHTVSPTSNTTYTANFSSGTGDAYEPDDSFAAAKTITDGETQSRSIHVAGNRDYVEFFLSSGGDVTLETDGASGDTVLYLYDGSQNLVTSDDDGGNGYFSLLSVTGLAADTYYAVVEEYGNNGTIASYTLSLTVGGGSWANPNLRATCSSSTTINLDWTDVASPYGYTLYKSSQPDRSDQTWVFLSAGTTSYAATGLTPGIRYYFDLNVNKTPEERLSEVTAATIPTNFTATASSSTQIDLTWGDTAMGKGYTLYKSTQPDLSGASFHFVAAGVTSYSFSGLDPSTTYYFGLNTTNDYWGNEYRLAETNAMTPGSGGPSDPDLRVVSVNAPDGTYAPGDSFSVSNSTVNDGGDCSGYSVAFYASTNTTISASDTLIGSFSRGSLASGATHSYNSPVTLPVSLPEADYYIGMLVTCAGDSDTSNNTGYDATRITVEDPVVPGTVSWSVSSRNFGTVTVGSSQDYTFSLIHTGGASVSGVIGVSGSGFSIVSGGGAYTLSSGSRSITVRFAPISDGAKAGTLSVTGGGNPTATLTGTGSTPAVVPSGDNGCSPSGRSGGAAAALAWLLPLAAAGLVVGRRRRRGRSRRDSARGRSAHDVGGGMILT